MGDDPDLKGYPGPPGWGFGVGLTTPHTVRNLLLRKSNKGKSWIDLTMTDGKGLRRWRELVTGKNGRILFDRPKPTVGCSASGIIIIIIIIIIILCISPPSLYTFMMYKGHI
jgi:hypothetical protein